MSSGDDIQRVRDYYSSLSDSALIAASTGDAAGLTPEAMELVKEEIRKRGLGESVIKGLEAQNQPINEVGIDDYIALLQELPCPYCGEESQKLNAVILNKVTSVIIITQSKNSMAIACPTCLRKRQNEALVYSLAFGWWGMPWGIYRTIKSIFINTSNIRHIQEGTPSPILRQFTVTNIGRLVHMINENEDLVSLIAMRP